MKANPLEVVLQHCIVRGRVGVLALLVFSLVGAVLTGCGTDVGETASVDRPVDEAAGPLDEAIRSAARSSGVPADILRAVILRSSRGEDLRPPEEHIPHGSGLDEERHPGIPALWGPMGLREGWSLDEAAALTGVSAALIQTDLRANVEAGAQWIAGHALRRLGRIPASDEAEAWAPVLADGVGSGDADVDAAVVRELAGPLARGVDHTLSTGEVVHLVPSAAWATWLAGIRSIPGVDGGQWGAVGSAAGMAGVRQRPASTQNYTRGRNDRVSQIVIHTMQGSYSGSISWFANPNAGASAHYCVSTGGDITQTVDENDNAWHAGHAPTNNRSVGIEHEGFVNDASWYTATMYEASARLACDIAKRYGIPVDRQHIIGHSEVPGCGTSGGGGRGCHTDPGRHWNWTRYLQLVGDCVGTGVGGGTTGGSSGGSPGGTTGGTTGGSSGGSPGGSTGQTGTQKTGRLTGTVHVLGNTAQRIGGAEIRIQNGPTLQADSRGFWTVDLPPGTYAIDASAVGYSPATTRRQVASNATAWVSHHLAPLDSAAQAPGEISGIIFETNDSGQRVPIDGAKVAAGGQRATTGADGRFSLSVPPGTYTVNISATNHLSKQFRIDVVSRGRHDASAELPRKEATPAATGVVSGTIVTMAGAALGGVELTLRGTPGTWFATSNSLGGFNFERLSSGTWQLVAHKDGYLDSVTTTAVSAGSERIVRVVMQPIPAAPGSGSTGSGSGSSTGSGSGSSTGTGTGSGSGSTPAASGKVVGVVYIAPNPSNRIANATIRLSDGRTIQTDAAGYYETTGSGTVTVTATASGYIPGSASRPVRPGNVVWVSVGLKKATGGGSSKATQLACTPKGPKKSHSVNRMPELLSPLDGAVVTTRPTFEFRMADDPTANAVIQLLPAGQTRSIEWLIPAAGPAVRRVQPPSALAPGIYTWTVIPRWDDCDEVPNAIFGLFEVR